MSSTFDAAGDEHERTLHLSEQPLQVLELGEEQEAGVGRQHVRDRLRRGMRTVGRAERVVDVEVHSLRQLARGRRVVLRLAGQKARVLEHANAVIGQELREPGRDRRDRERGIDALRTAQVRAHDDLGRAALEQELERRQRRADPRVVGDATVLERHVEVAADEDALSLDLRGLDRAWVQAETSVSD